MKLSTKSRYGTRMLLDIAMNGGEGPVRIGDISKRQGVSIKYLEKLIRPLKEGGLIKGKRGPKGGHTLTLPPSEISVGTVVRLMEGEFILTECVKDETICKISHDCLTRRVWKEAADAMYAKLDSVTFADLIEEARRAGRDVHACIQNNKKK